MAEVVGQKWMGWRSRPSPADQNNLAVPSRPVPEVLRFLAALVAGFPFQPLDSFV